MGDQRHKRKYASGVLKQVTPEWKASVVAALKARGESWTWLAKQVGCDKSALTVLMRETTTVSRLVDAICLALEMMIELRASNRRAYDVAKTLLACMVERKSRKSRPRN